MYPLLLMSSVAVILDQHIKIPPNLKRAWRDALCLFGRDRAAHQSTVFLFGGLCCQIYIDNKRADELWGISQVHRLCVLASGTSAFVIFSCFAFINVCLWHLGQNRGKFFSSVSSRICTLVLLPQTGHNINSSFCIRYASSNKVYHRILLWAGLHLAKGSYYHFLSFNIRTPKMI